MSRAVIQPFEEYQRARVIFVQTVAALAGGKDNRNVELLKRLDAIRLLGPLLTDPVISIKQYAALAIGTLAGADEEIASQVVNDDNGHILNLILKSLETSNRFYKKTACRLLGKLSKWKSLAAKVVSGGVITFLVSCLEDCDGEVKLFAASALQKICMNGEDLAREVINAGAIEPLSLCLQEPDIKLKRQAVLTMSNIAKHSDSHTRRLCEEKETLGVILHYLQTKDTMLSRQVLLCLSYIAQNSSDKAAQIINSLNNQLLEENIAGATKANIYSIRSATDTSPVRRADPICQQNCLSLLYNIAKHGSGHTNQVSAKIKCETLIRFLETNQGPARNVGLQLISTLAQYSKEQAEQIKNLEGFAQTVSFDSPLDGTDSSTLGDLISDEREDIHLSVEKQLMRERVREALDDMTVEESEILRMCYGIGRRKMSTQEIAEEMFLSRRRIQQLIQKAEDHLELRLRKYFVNED